MTNVLSHVPARTSTAGPTTLDESVQLAGEVSARVSERTLEIVDRRRRTAVVRRRGWLVRRLLLTADLVGLVAAMVIAESLAQRWDAGGSTSAREFVAFLVSLPAWLVVAKLYGLYDGDERRTDHSTADDFSAVFNTITVGTFLFWALLHLTGVVHLHWPKLLVLWVTAVPFVLVSRAAARSIARRSPTYVQNAVIVGAGDVGQTIAKKILQHREYGLNLVGFVDSHPKERREGLEHVSLLGGIDRLPATVRLLDIDRVIIAFSSEPHSRTLDLVRALKDLDIQIDIVPRLFEVFAPTDASHTVEGLPLLGLPPLKLSRSARLLKRAFDLALTVPALLLLSPVLLLIAALIKLESRGPVFFRQVRMGSGDRTFRIFKFRSMTADADARKAEVAHLNMHLAPGGDPRMFKIPDDPRITRVGKWLRKLSLDELPQLINVVRGEMSLVGPRPLILDEDRFIEDWGRQRLKLKPGVTGLWQVLGRSEIPFEEMVRLDYVYVTGWSLMGDVRLVLRTVPALFRSAHGAL